MRPHDIRAHGANAARQACRHAPAVVVDVNDEDAEGHYLRAHHRASGLELRALGENAVIMGN